MSFHSEFEFNLHASKCCLILPLFLDLNIHTHQNITLKSIFKHYMHKKLQKSSIQIKLSLFSENEFSVTLLSAINFGNLFRLSGKNRLSQVPNMSMSQRILTNDILCAHSFDEIICFKPVLTLFSLRIDENTRHYLMHMNSLMTSIQPIETVKQINFLP